MNLKDAVPANVRDVCRTLTEAGHEAVTVGGAVRDAMLDRDPGDWDVATSAHPDEVLKLFRHTIPTGLQHGTVTVVTGKGAHTHVEVTTFRGEGAYTDARRPDHVVFGVPLVEDLARRDLTVNAMAYDPARDVLVDPFGGRADLAARRLRAVGNAVERFTEDGLRVMRAVRFCAQLEFDLDPETEAGIGPALPSLVKVSRERVSDELRKLLATRAPSRGLVPAVRSKIIETILPDLTSIDAERVDRASERTRLAALVVCLASADAPPTMLDRKVSRRVADLLRALKFSNAELGLAADLVAVAHAPRHAEWTASDVRRVLSQLGRDKREAAVELWESDANRALATLARQVLGDPLEVGDLAVTGKELMDALAMPPGPAVGRILGMLLQRVLDDPSRNTKDYLKQAAQELELEVGR
jgi:tRNA nucleotidyltransferase (CCA-adding enzyme)